MKMTRTVGEESYTEDGEDEDEGGGGLEYEGGDEGEDEDEDENEVMWDEETLENYIDDFFDHVLVEGD